MKFVTYRLEGKEYPGIISKDGKHIISLNEILDVSQIDMVELIKGYSDELRDKIQNSMEKFSGIDIKKVKLVSPIPNPPRGIICLGKNYKDHIKEVAKAIDSKANIPEYPIYFSKLVDRCPGQNEIIPSQADYTEMLDYEAELAVVIGKGGKDIPPESAEEHIFGYTILNDISVRDAQGKHMQWFKGKSFDGSCPVGPWIVDSSEIRFPIELDIKSYINGQLRQDSNTREFIFDLPYIISDFSKGTTLKPGDIIATGTPAGVGMGFNPGKYLKKGDTVECFIEKIGYLKNTVL